MSKAVQVACLLLYLLKCRLPGRSQYRLPCVTSWAVVLMKISSSPEDFLNGRIVSCAKMTWFYVYTVVHVFGLNTSCVQNKLCLSWKKDGVTCQSVRPLMIWCKGDIWAGRHSDAVQPDTTLIVLVKMDIEEGRGMVITGFWHLGACIFPPSLYGVEDVIFELTSSIREDLRGRDI